MKSTILTKIIVMAAMSVVSLKVSAQNVQLHYDLGRNIATSTVEMFKQDAGGSTFLFVDLDYSPKVSGAYWEIAREFCFWQDSKVNWLSAHLEYNGGLDTTAGSYNNCWLAGATYFGHSEDYSKTWSVTASYKIIPGTICLGGAKQPHSFQITGVWNLDFFNNWLSFNGFADFWREPRNWRGADSWSETYFIFISEPQLWVNLRNIKGWENINLSVGTEVELSVNFANKGFNAMPTVGAKWTF